MRQREHAAGEPVPRAGAAVAAGARTVVIVVIAGEIARLLEVPPATVRNRLFRARKAMVALVAKLPAEGER